MYGDWVDRKVRFVLKHMKEIREETACARAERKARKGAPEMHGEGYVSNPTAKEAEINMTPLPIIHMAGGLYLENPEAWIGCVDRVKAGMDASGRDLIEGMERGAKWRDETERLHMNKETLYRRRDRVVALIAMEAIQRGILRI